MTLPKTKRLGEYSFPEASTQVFLCLLFTVFLFFAGKDGYETLPQVKYGLFLVLCGGYCFFLILHCSFNSRGLTGEKGIVYSGLAYLLFTALSTVLSPYFPKTVVGVSRQEGFLTIFLYVALFFLVLNFGQASRQLLYVTAISVTLFDILCIFQLYGVNLLHLYPDGLSYADSHVKFRGAFLGTIGNIDFVASFFCLIIPILFAAIFRLKEKKRFFLFLPLILSLFVLLKMWVLAGIVGVFCGLILSVPVLFSFKKDRLALYWLSLISGVLLLIIVVMAFDFSFEPLHSLHAFLRGFDNVSFDSGRIYIWREVLKRVPERLWFGHGPDTMLLDNIKSFTRYDSTLRTLVVSRIDVAHNEYLNILYHQGVLGLSSYLLFLFFVLKKIVKSRGEVIIQIVAPGIIAYLIQAFFGISTCIVAPFFWVLIGLINSPPHTCDFSRGRFTAI